MKPSKTTAIDRLANSRLELETRFGDLRRAVESEIGWAPKSRTWVLPLVAFASGVALAAWLVARRRDG